MVAMDDVMETGEGPENAKDGEQFAEEYLKSIVLYSYFTNNCALYTATIFFYFVRFES